MDRVVLMDGTGRKWLVPLDQETVSVRGLGVLPAEKLKASVGRPLRIGDRTLLVLRPSSNDLAETLHRDAQIVTAKDAAMLLRHADVMPAARVVEAGSGSGALTIALARAVGPQGRVVSYDMREDFLEVARGNVERAGLSDRVDFRLGDVRDRIEGPADAVLLDMPDPWNAVAAAHGALVPCGHVAAYVPNMEQVKETVLALRRLPFVEVRTIEVLEREMEVRDAGIRPSFAALGHTGYLTFARKVLEPFAVRA